MREAEVNEFVLGKEWMDFDLVHGGFDLGVFEEGSDLLRGEVGETDRFGEIGFV